MTNYQKRMAAYAEEAARLAACDNTADLERAVRWLRQAECIVIGGAAGLSAAGGMDYMSRQVLEEQFPALAGPVGPGADRDPALGHDSGRSAVGLHRLPGGVLL